MGGVEAAWNLDWFVWVGWRAAWILDWLCGWGGGLHGILTVCGMGWRAAWNLDCLWGGVEG